MSESASALVENGFLPAGVLTIPGGLSEQNLQAFSDRLSSRHGGARNMHKVAIISGQATFTGLSLPADDMQFVQQRELSTREIARIFGVPAHMIDGATGDSLTYANVEQQSLQFVTYSLRPWLCLIEQAVSADPDLCSQNVYCEFLVDALLRADSKSRAETYSLALDPVKGWMTRDEVRQRENLQAETNTAPPAVPQPQFNGAVA